MEHARKRLAEIEERWAHLDAVIAHVRGLANAQMQTDEQQLRAKTDEDIQRILEYSNFKIGLAARRARQELVAFGTETAIALARQSIRIGEKTDRKLISAFLRELEDGVRVAESTAETATPRA